MSGSDPRSPVRADRTDPRVAVPGRLERSLLRLRAAFHRRLAEDLGLPFRPGDADGLAGRPDRDVLADLERRARQEEEARWLASLPWWRRWLVIARGRKRRLR